MPDYYSLWQGHLLYRLPLSTLGALQAALAVDPSGVYGWLVGSCWPSLEAVEGALSVEDLAEGLWGLWSPSAFTNLPVDALPTRPYSGLMQNYEKWVRAMEAARETSSLTAIETALRVDPPGVYVWLFDAGWESLDAFASLFSIAEVGEILWDLWTPSFEPPTVGGEVV